MQKTIPTKKHTPMSEAQEEKWGVTTECTSGPFMGAILYVDTFPLPGQNWGERESTGMSDNCSCPGISMHNPTSFSNNQKKEK